ncbi:NmrA family NAD(P)-binding protein [Paraburkholderia caribensis]|uniref:NmrA family NAD(P)-binding protein n=1 Tax=Paraburkholderia caribensis TaxID=75105 RepID=UPI001CB10580|nr:NmrA family NAD(P)-binding protein [Paraburkholderia caribensis]CAG9243785.1 NmrA family transcriptional regulator [Paraburkholderia caribensis]
MYAVTGITGKVGGAVAKTLLASQQRVRAVLRNPQKADQFAQADCEIAIADFRDVAALTKAFSGSDGVFVMLPPNFDPSVDFHETHEIISALKNAIVTARPKRVVALSTVGAQASQQSLLTQLHDFEKALRDVQLPTAFVRAAWFMENSVWDVAPARTTGVVPAFLQPVDRQIPMVAARDIGQVIATTLQEEWTGLRTIELKGPSPISPNDIAATYARLLGRQVHAQIVPRETWETLFRSHGMKNPIPRIQMLDGFNEGWLSFEGEGTESRVGETTLEEVLQRLINQTA